MSVVWLASVVTVGILFFVTLLVARQVVLVFCSFPIWASAGMAVVILFASISIPRKLAEQAILLRDPGGVQRAMIVGAALSETLCILGTLSHFVTGSSHSYFFFWAAVAGLVLNFPRRSDVAAALSSPGL